jgi:C-terminal processing protease CtpA/Prc
LWKFTSPVEVIGLQANGPAERAGIRKGDRITAVDGNPIGSEKGSEAFSNLRAGKATKFTILRSDGSEVTLTVVPAPQETRGNHD